eukprot:COSAG05_NODE_869_length_6866_cov_20.524457_3_plen_159_part_00
MRYNNGTASIIPAPRNVHHNLFLGTYNSQENMDNDVSAGANHQSSSDIGDILVYHIILPLPVLLVTLQDGSAYYHTHDNVFIYGDNGLKSNFGGHDNVHTKNIYAYVGTCFYGNPCRSCATPAVFSNATFTEVKASTPSQRRTHLNRSCYTSIERLYH